jgi:hypothetical protein
LADDATGNNQALLEAWHADYLTQKLIYYQGLQALLKGRETSDELAEVEDDPAIVQDWSTKGQRQWLNRQRQSPASLELDASSGSSSSSSEGRHTPAPANKMGLVSERPDIGAGNARPGRRVSNSATRRMISDMQGCLYGVPLCNRQI